MRFKGESPQKPKRKKAVGQLPSLKPRQIKLIKRTVVIKIRVQKAGHNRSNKIPFK